MGDLPLRDLGLHDAWARSTRREDARGGGNEPFASTGDLVHAFEQTGERDVSQTAAASSLRCCRRRGQTARGAWAAKEQRGVALGSPTPSGGQRRHGPLGRRLLFLLARRLRGLRHPQSCSRR
jgi:hypothetical protein